MEADAAISEFDYKHKGNISPITTERKGDGRINKEQRGKIGTNETHNCRTRQQINSTELSPS
jgi:hypothetical protein